MKSLRQGPGLARGRRGGPQAALRKQRALAADIGRRLGMTPERANGALGEFTL